MHHGYDLDVISSFSKQNAVRKSSNAAFADILCKDAEEQRLAPDSSQRAFHGISQSKPQPLLPLLVVMSGFTEFLQGGWMKPYWFHANDRRSSAIAGSAGRPWTFPASSSWHRFLISLSQTSLTAKSSSKSSVSSSFSARYALASDGKAIASSASSVNVRGTVRR